MRSAFFLYLAFASGVACAQTTDAITQVPAHQPVNRTEVPPGGCMPLGVTASGEIVFPFQCKEFIEQHRGADPEQPRAAEQAPAVVGEKPTAPESTAAAVEEQPNLEQSAIAPPENSKFSIKQTGIVSRVMSKVSRARREGAQGCQHFRTFDPESESYRGFDGKRRSCR